MNLNILKHKLWEFAEKSTVGNRVLYLRKLGNHYTVAYNRNHIDFIINYARKNRFVPLKSEKTVQVCKLISELSISPISNNSFFYSIDCYKTLDNQFRVLDNYTINYDIIVNGSFNDIVNQIPPNSDYYNNTQLLLDSFDKYIERMESSSISQQYQHQIDAIKSLKYRASQTVFEALQRILFFNQFLWQTAHKHNGLGRLDYLLDRVYQQDVRNNHVTSDEIKNLFIDFFKVLHELCWYKSNTLLGDTGQIAVLGGTLQDGSYFSNDITRIIIDTLAQLRLPEPKIIVRCSESMPQDILNACITCISTGIGSPLLSNDDEIIPRLIEYGYNSEYAHNYVTSACWEPLVIDGGCEQNNMYSINFATPFVTMLKERATSDIKNFNDLLSLYFDYLNDYLAPILCKLSRIQFEPDPLISLVSNHSAHKMQYITAKCGMYNTIGLTSVGLSSVVDSLLNIDNYCFINHTYSLEQLENFRRKNFVGNENFRLALKEINGFACDNIKSIELTNSIIKQTGYLLQQSEPLLHCKFKFGLSSPGYIDLGRITEATLDGRLDYDPFPIHISLNKPAPITQLLNFASKIDYNNMCINGNVVDMIVSPSYLEKHRENFSSMLKIAFKQGIYQLQLNVISSSTLIAAKFHPEKYQNLVVRVWGFSSYFNDLPDEYKDYLINRAIESEAGCY